MIRIAQVMSFANAARGKLFKWGTTDCNTITLQFLDMIMARQPSYTSITEEVVGKYSTKADAYYFYKAYKNTKFSWDTFLLQFCDKNPTKPLFQAGDIILAPVGNILIGSHICLGGESLSIDPELGAIIVPTLDLIRLGNIDIYRPRL